jgi:trigger factor
LKVTTESLESRQLSMVIEIDEEQTQQAMRRAARQISRQVNFPGFRKGKAPYELVLQRYGEDTIRREAADVLVEDAYNDALDQQEIEPYAAGMLENIELDPITFTFTIPLSPMVDLGDYRGYRLKAPKVRVYKKDVQEALQEVRRQNAVLEQVDRPAELEDGIVASLVGVTADGEEIFQGDDLHFLLEAGSTDPAPGFAEEIVGMEVGEERSFTLTLGDDFAREDLRGQEVEFTVNLTEVYNSTLPKLDDDLARTVGNFDSIKALEKHIKDQLRQAEQQKVDETYANQVLEAIIDQAEVEYPPLILERELDSMIQEVEQTIKRQAKLSLEDYLRFQGKTVEELREDFTPDAQTRLKRGLVLSEVVKTEQLEVDAGEIDAQIEAISAPWGVRANEIRESLNSEQGQATVRSRVLSGKAVQRLVAIAKGEAPELSAQETSESEDLEKPEVAEIAETEEEQE